jgi:hypothetical protein
MPNENNNLNTEQHNGGFGGRNIIDHNTPFIYDDVEKALKEALNMDSRDIQQNNVHSAHTNPYLQQNLEAEEENYRNQQARLKFEQNNNAPNVPPSKQREYVKPIVDTFDIREYVPFDINLLPCSDFYPMNSNIYIKACLVKDIQNYSMVDDSNSLVAQLDLVTKLNSLMENNVKIKFPDGRFANYKSIFEADKVPIVYGLRELTFTNGKPLSETEKCTCGREVVIPITSKNLTKIKYNEKLKKYYTSDGFFSFPTEKYGIIKARPTTIGLQQVIYEYCGKMNAEGKSINLSALEVLPFFIHQDNLTVEDIENKVKEYENVDMDYFVVLLKIAQELKTAFGIKTAYITCECGLEVHTERVFPNKPSTLFINDGGFDEFVI